MPKIGAYRSVSDPEEAVRPPIIRRRKSAQKTRHELFFGSEFNGTESDSISSRGPTPIPIYIENAPPPVTALVDPNVTVQVLENLVSNAVKYSPPGKNIYARLKAVGGAARFEIQDEGPGLSQEDRAKLFGKFARLSAKPTGGEHATGLGLSIVKKMVEAMNGKVWCESEPGEGARFVVEFSKV